MFSANSSQVSDDKLFVEDVFSTYLYTGNSSTQTITNGIDLSGKGGLVWIKRRDNANSHALLDTNRGANKTLQSNSTNAENTNVSINWAFNSTGFSQNNSFTDLNNSAGTYASWTFRKAPKFFDVVTYTGDGTANRSIAHNLGAAPGCIIIKRTDTTSAWSVYHRSLGAGTNGLLNLNLNTTGDALDSGLFPSAASSTDFKVNQYSGVNASGGTYVAYLFAHDTTSDGIIQCGSFTTDGSANGSVNLGWEPQWVLVKPASFTGSWQLVDAMRGMTADKLASQVLPNTNTAEQSLSDLVGITSTGFTVGANGPGLNMTVIYIAIRRGPMRTPTSGTSVFNAQTYTGDSSFDRMISTSTPAFPVDLAISRDRNTSDIYWYWSDRLRGKDNSLYSNASTFEDGGPYPYTAVVKFDLQTGLYASGIANNDSGKSFVAYSFMRAASYFDIACYTGTGSNTTVSHNLRATPELIIVKRRNSSGQWGVYTAGGGATKYLRLDQTDGEYVDATYWNNVAPTSSVFTIGTNTNVNSSGGNYVAYLFASAPGVSKVGTYTGNGTSQTIDCGFSGGARFVMIKRRDASGAWYVFDTARGIVAGNDPALTFNTANPETTSSDAIDTNSTGFVVNSTGGIINISGATYLYLAVA